MSKEKQIKEMMKIINQANGRDDDSNYYEQDAEDIYNAGYRKQSEVAREIFEEIGEKLHHWGALAEQDNSDYGELVEIVLEDIICDIAELKKKYTEEIN
jgi:hypothetical protein